MPQQRFEILNHGFELREVWTEDVSGFTHFPLTRTTPDRWFVRNPADGSVSEENELWYINHEGNRDKLRVRSEFFVQEPSAGGPGEQIAVWFEHVNEEGDGVGDRFHVIAHRAPDGRNKRAIQAQIHFRPPDEPQVKFVIENI